MGSPKIAMWVLLCGKVLVPERSGARPNDVVETALARALVLAAEAKRWDVVLRIAGELEVTGRATVGQIKARGSGR